MKISQKFIREDCVEIAKELLTKLKFHSKETYEHSLDVAKIYLMLGRTQKLSNDDLKTLYTCGLLHDVGKLNIDTNLLHKKGCTIEEINYIKNTHILETFKILKGKIDEDLLNICYHHHEQPNGEGYPQKLNNKQLSTFDKILQVADKVSAVTLNRSYRSKPYLEEDLEELMKKHMKIGYFDKKYGEIALEKVVKERCLSKKETVQEF